LGVTKSSDLTSEPHISEIVSKARQGTSTLFRSFLTPNLTTMRQASITYIRPILEYNSLVWNPTYIHLTDLIENVQQTFTKRIPSLSSSQYTERLVILDLDLPELCRLRLNLVYYYEVLNNLTHFNPSEVFIIYSPSERSRSALPSLQKPVKASKSFLSSLFYPEAYPHFKKWADTFSIPTPTHTPPLLFPTLPSTRLFPLPSLPLPFPPLPFSLLHLLLPSPSNSSSRPYSLLLPYPCLRGVWGYSPGTILEITDARRSVFALF
jgi:hypothetical protein